MTVDEEMGSLNEDLNEVLIVEEQRGLESTGIFTLCVPHRKLLSPVNSKNCLSSAVRATSSRLPAVLRSVALQYCKSPCKSP